MPTRMTFEIYDQWLKQKTSYENVLKQNPTRTSVENLLKEINKKLATAVVVAK
jgi:hypothetical protein